MVARQGSLLEVGTSIVEDDMGVRATEAEAVDACSSQAIDRPRSEFGGNLERRRALDFSLARGLHKQRQRHPMLMK